MFSKRIDGIDLLRGIAIFIMFIDHILLLAFQQSISLSSLRFFTRIAEPLFVIIAGYLLGGRDPKKLFFRTIEILSVSLFINLFYYRLMGKFEILMSFSILLFLYLLWLIIKQFITSLKLKNVKFFSDFMSIAHINHEKLYTFILFLFLFFAYILAYDPTLSILDYPLFIIIAQLSLGALMRKKVEWYYSFLILPAFFVAGPFRYTILFTPIAAYLMSYSVNIEHIHSNILKYVKEIGKRPLFFYALQYALAFLITILVCKIGFH